MSLGADKSMVERMILTQGLKLTLAAVGIGAAAALGLTRLLRSLPSPRVASSQPIGGERSRRESTRLV